MDFTGKVAIVTGASAGIGRAYALALAAAGASVVAAARGLGRPGEGAPEPDTLAEVVAAGAKLPGKIYAQVCDLTVDEDVARLVEQTAANFGRIDVLVNNAGMFPHHSALEITREQWYASMDLNLRAAYLTIRHTAPHMIARRRGSIINITAVAASASPKGSPGHDGLLMYTLSKSALNRLTSYMAEELKEHGIAVNAMAPGVVRTRGLRQAPEAGAAITRIAPLVKAATPEAMGPPLLYLAAQTAETLTGQVLHADAFGKGWG